MQKSDQIISEQAVLDGPIVHKDQTQLRQLVRNEQGRFVPINQARPKVMIAPVQHEPVQHLEPGGAPIIQKDTDKHVQRP